jgi:SAM-dependent methyltransferase
MASQNHPDGPTMSSSQSYASERMIPDTAGTRTFWEHIYRYRFAVAFAPGKRVVDIACGEGYGTAALVASGAASVVGIDISEETCQHARRKYGIDARVGSAEAIPLDDSSMDLVVSFETIEHLARPHAFLHECRRILAPGGTLIISTPSKEQYAASGGASPFHCSEMTDVEFKALLEESFDRCCFYGQGPWQVGVFSRLGPGSSTWPLLRIPGVWRSRDLLRKIASPHMDTVTSEHRTEASSWILKQDSLLGAILNPYRIWRESGDPHETFIYVIAVVHT